VAAYVQAAHDAGLRVSSIVYGIEGIPPLRKLCPELSEMACRLANGEIADVGGFVLMCTNNPDWVAWEIAYGKRGIDHGADMILVDTPMGASFVSGGFLKGGFCTSCMDRFKKYLTDTFTPKEMLERFAIETLEGPDLIRRLSSRQIVGPPDSPRAFRNSDPNDLLFREFIRNQEHGAFDTRRGEVRHLLSHRVQTGQATSVLSRPGRVDSTASRACLTTPPSWNAASTPFIDQSACTQVFRAISAEARMDAPDGAFWWKTRQITARELDDHDSDHHETRSVADENDRTAADDELSQILAGGWEAALPLGVKSVRPVGSATLSFSPAGQPSHARGLAIKIDSCYEPR
jgi:hypothetical protein